jgi:hypothetical protein
VANRDITQYIDVEQLQALTRRKPQRYNSRGQTVDGIRFASQGEVRLYRYYQMLQAAGEIEQLEADKKKLRLDIIPEGSVCYWSGDPLPHLRYEADFSFYDLEAARWVYADYKGIKVDKRGNRTPRMEKLAQLKLAILRHPERSPYPYIEFRIVTDDDF